MKPETKAIHIPAGRDRGNIAPPLRLTTTFEHGADARERPHDYLYVRHDNPNVEQLEQRLSALEGGIGAKCFASGMAAGVAVLNTLPPGSTVIFHQSVYFDFLTFGRSRAKDWGLSVKVIDCRDESALDAALSRGAALVWLESPANPTMDLIDIAALSEKARAVGTRTIVDGTFATPALQQPFGLGADYVLHSLTKYIGGHSDVQGGAIVVRDDEELLNKLQTIRKLTGGVLAPFNAWLINRGLQTMHCRMEKHSSNALAIAEALDKHPAVDRVRYPLLASNPDIELARAQMSAGGGMLSFDVAGGRDSALRVAGSLKLITNATSLGGTETLIEHRKSIEGPESVTPDNLLRLSVGLEHADDLIDDLAAALDSL